MAHKFDGRWFFCELCDTVSLRLPCCGNTTCNGGGCEKCDKEWDEAWEMIHNGTAPKKEDIPFIPKPDFNTFGL